MKTKDKLDKLIEKLEQMNSSGREYSMVKIHSDGSGDLVCGVDEEYIGTFDNTSEMFEVLDEQLAENEPVELTLEEIAEKFDIDVTRIRIKE